MLLAALPALHASVRIAGAKEEDLRRILPSLVLENHPDAAFDYYTSFGRTRGRPARHGRLPDGDSSLLVTASFVYDRYGAIAASDLQKDAVRLRAARYADLFRHPYLEVSNGRPSFAFFNPVLRVVALDGDKEQLSRLAAELRAKYPDLTLTLVNAKP